ncbi:MAG: response regulator transcription factor, partial [Polaribacter sp.]
FSNDIQSILLKSISGQMVPQGDMPDDFLLKSLTERELDVLKLITKEYSTIEMADLLNLSTNTVETYRKSLLKKLNVKNAVGLAMYAVKNKIV